MNGAWSENLIVNLSVLQDGWRKNVERKERMNWEEIRGFRAVRSRRVSPKVHQNRSPYGSSVGVDLQERPLLTPEIH